MPDYEIVIKPVSEMRVAKIRLVVPTMESLSEWLSKGFNDIASYLEASGVTPIGAPFEIWYDREFTGLNMDIETMVPIPADASIEGTEHIHIHVVPGVERMACALHRGAYTALGQAHAALHTYLADNKLKIVGPSRCVYYEHHGDANSADNLSEIQYPVAPI